MRRIADQHERVVITGMGLVTSTGDHREAAWRAVREGRCNIQFLKDVAGIPDGKLLGAQVHIERDYPGQLKDIPLCRTAAIEALDDASLSWPDFDPHRFGCSASAHMGDLEYIVEQVGRRELIPPGKGPWWQQWLPNTACASLADHFDLRGPRLCNSTACASGTIAVLQAMRAIQDDQSDLMLVGSSQVIHPLFACGFHNMRVLASHSDPSQACRPFDRWRTGFVMGEGAASLVLERLSHALDRGAAIYAEILGGMMLSDGRHVTSLDGGCDTLVQLISATLRKSRLAPSDVQHVNAHGTGTEQNDLTESQGIRAAFGRAADGLSVTANKSMLGHLVNASGAVELALTALALRDGFAPPTINLTDPDPRCTLDCLPLLGRRQTMEHALKLSIAFGGHLAAVALRRWSAAGERPSLLPLARAA